ncbi:MAG: hypothetical protein KGD74_08945 [Candidatus Lokiarchaeota archaeon]|nr:hypothetical protein [Candidatus Lokiarchaeota archaeon]
MAFISGLKGVFKRPLYVFIIGAFSLTWILILVNSYFNNVILGLAVLIFGGSLLYFVIILFLISFIKPIDQLKKSVFFIIYVITIFLTFVLNRLVFFITSELIVIIPLTINQFFTAYFAFKICMDSSTKVDDYLYKKKKSRILTRLLEFIFFFMLNWWFSIIILRFFSTTPTPLFLVVIRILQILFWVNVSLIIIVILRLIVTKKFSAYISLFFLLTLFYALYILVDYLYGAFFSSASVDPIYVLISFIVDWFLFIYILGVVYSRSGYIQTKLKFLKVDTVALFLVIMKIYVQVSKIVPKIVSDEIQILQAGGLFIIFVFFNLIFGIHSILAHKQKKEKKSKK